MVARAVRIATYNVHRCVGADGLYAAGDIRQDSAAQAIAAAGDGATAAIAAWRYIKANFIRGSDRHRTEN